MRYLTRLMSASLRLKVTLSITTVPMLGRFAGVGIQKA